MQVELTQGRVTDVGAQQIGAIVEVDDKVLKAVDNRTDEEKKQGKEIVPSTEYQRMVKAGHCKPVEAMVTSGGRENASRDNRPNSRA